MAIKLDLINNVVMSECVCNDALVLLGGHRTGDPQVAGSTPGWTCASYLHLFLFSR